jgi:hypothetical protein
VLPHGAPIAVPTLRFGETELRILIPMVGVQARQWVQDCLMLGRMELMFASKTHACCLCVSIQNHARWFRAAETVPPSALRSQSQALSELQEAAKLLREHRSPDVVDQWFWGASASVGHAVKLDPAPVTNQPVGPSHA